MANPDNNYSQRPPIKIIAGVICLIIAVAFVLSSFYVVEPGNRGIMVTLGHVKPEPLEQGFGFKWPLISHVATVSVRQDTQEAMAECYSADLQQINIKIKILYSVPEASVVTIFQHYSGEPFETLVVPRVQEALKEQTALLSAEQIVKGRETVKANALKSAAQKVGDVVKIDDLVLENITLSKELENAIEEKMVQEQNASKAKFEQDKRKIDADTKVIEARAEAESIKVRGEALRQTPELINLQIVEKWDGRTPLVVGSGAAGAGGATILLPLPNLPANTFQPLQTKDSTQP